MPSFISTGGLSLGKILRVKKTDFVIRLHFQFSFTIGELNKFLFASNCSQNLINHSDSLKIINVFKRILGRSNYFAPTADTLTN